MFVARREIRRRTGRFALLTGAVALLVVLLLFFQSVAAALTTGITGGVENNDADVFVYSDRARRNPAASFVDPGAVARVADVDGVARAAGVARAQFTDGEADAEVTMIGLQDPEVGGPASIAEGRRPQDRGEAVVSVPGLSTGDVAYEVGDLITIEGIELTLVGRADDAAFDVGPTFYVDVEDVLAMRRAKAGAQVAPLLSWVAVDIADGSSAGDVADRITETTSTGSGSPGGLEAITRSAAAAALPGAEQITQSFSILYLLLFVVVTVLTGVFFLILTVQKQDSLVLMRALGASRVDAVRPVLVEVLVVVGLGSLLGTGVAAGLLWAARDQFGSTLDPGTTVLSVGLILVLGIVASLGAVRRVLAIDPVQAAAAGGH